MPLYISQDDLNNFQGDDWAQKAQGQIADTWAQQAIGNAPTMAADAENRVAQQAQQQAQAIAQRAATVAAYDSGQSPQTRVALRQSVGSYLQSQGWPQASIDRVLSSPMFNGQTSQDLEKIEAQRQAQSSATGAYYQGSLSPSPVPAAGDVSGWRAYLAPYVPDDLKSDPNFLNTVLAGAHAESGLDARRYQIGYDPNDPTTHAKFGGRGLFQFDINPGAKGAGLSDEQLFDPAYQAQTIIPEYAAAYRSAPSNLSPDARAAYIDAQVERPDGWNDPNSAARQNYANSYRLVSGVGAAPSTASTSESNG